MASARKTPATFLSGLLREAGPVELLEPLAWELGYRDPRRTHAALAKYIGEALPLDSAGTMIRTWPPGPRAVSRWLFGRVAEALSARVAGRSAVESLREAGVRLYAGPTVPEPQRRTAALTGGVLFQGEYAELSDVPQIVHRGVQAQVQAAQVRAHLYRVITTAGAVRAHRLAVDTLRTTLPLVPRLPALAEPQPWVQRAWRAATNFGYRVDLAEPEARAALGALAGETPAVFLEHLFAAWAAETTAETPAAFDLFGPSAWRLVAACDQPTPPALHRILCLAALEALPVDQWVEIAHFIDHLHRAGLLPPTCRGVNRTVTDPKTVPVTHLRPDHNEGEPFRLRVPYLLKLVLGVPALLGVVDVAFAPHGESVLNFSPPRARHVLCESPYREVTHLRRTSLGARWLDPLARPPPLDHGPGADGLDALADLLG